MKFVSHGAGQTRLRGNFMKTTWLILGVLVAAQVSSAQTNEPVVQVKFYSYTNATNKITFLVKGPVQSIKGVVKGTFPKSGTILVAKMIPVVDEQGFPVYDWQGLSVLQESDNEIVVANYPSLDNLATGAKISFHARTIGTIRGKNRDGTDSSTVLELWEYYTPPQPTPEEIAAAKAAQDKANAEAKAKAAAQKKAIAAKVLKSNQDDAAKGDAYGLLRMGERYRDGESVEKDLTKAKEYLQKAADAGSPTAAEELSKLNQVLTNSTATK